MNYNYAYSNPNVVPMVPTKATQPANQNTVPNYNPYNQNQQQPGYPNQYNNYQQPNPYQQQQQNQNNPYQQPQQFQNQYNPTVPQQPNKQTQQFNNPQYNQYQQQQQQQHVNANKQPDAQVQYPEHQRQIELLKQRYPYQIVQPQFPSEIGKKTVVNIDLDIPNFKIPIKIELDYEFPKSKPAVFLRKRYLQINVNDSTLRFMYESNFRWDPNSTNLLNLVTAIHQMLQQTPPYPDNLFDQFKEKKESIKEHQEKQNFAAFDVQKVFPGYTTHQFQEILKKSSFAEQILTLPEVESLKNKVADLANFNVKVSSDMIDQQASLEVKKMNTDELAQQYEGLQQQLQQKISITNNIKERFGDMSIIQALSQKIYEVEEQGQNIRCNNIEDEIRAYKANRQQYHMLNIQREKLTNSN